MEVARPAYYYGDDQDHDSVLHGVSHYDLFELFVYVVYVGDGVECGGVRGVLTLYEL